MTTRKILIPLDQSTTSEQILQAVQQLFKPDETKLILMSVVQPSIPTSMDRPHVVPTHYPLTAEMLDYGAAFNYQEWKEHWDREREVVASGLRTTQQRLHSAGYIVSTLLRIGDPVQEIVTCAEDGDYDLLAMTTHGRTGLNRLMMGSVAEKVLRNVSIPILLMRPMAESATTQSAEEKLPATVTTDNPLTITVATDGSFHGKHAVTLGCELRQALNADLKLLVTVNEGVDAAHAQGIMQATLGDLDHLQVKPETVPLVGRVDVNVERYIAENPADLLVIGAFKDKGAGASSAIGQTAQQIIQYAPASVLVTKGYSKKIQTILACVAPDDADVLDVASHFAQAFEAKLKVLHVLPISKEQKPHLVDMSKLPLNEILARGPIQREADAGSVIPVSLEEATVDAPTTAGFLQKTAATLESISTDGSGLLIRRGAVVESILHVAQEEKPDLIVVGSQSGPGYFMGSAASNIVGLAPQSVMVVRTKFAGSMS